MMNKENTLAKNTLLLTVGTILTKGLTFLMVPFYSRWLSAADYGTFDLLCTYVSLLLPIIGLSSNEALFRFAVESDSDEEKKKYTTNCLFIYGIGTGIFLAAVLFLKRIIGWNLAYYFFVLVLGEIFNLHLRGFLRAIKKISIYSFVNAAVTVLIAVFATLFIRVFQMGLVGIILGYGLGYIVGDVLIVVISRYYRYISFKYVSVKESKKLIDYSFVLIPNSIAWWFINVSDRTIINSFIGAAANGVYAIAYKIPNILSAVFGVFSVSWQQSVVETLSDKDRDEYFNKIYNKLTVILLSLCCGILSLNSWFFNYIFDIKYYDGYLYAPILIGSTVFATISQFYGSIQIGFKKPKENGITTTIGAISNLIIHLLLIKFIGLYAAAVSTILSQIIVCVLRVYRLEKQVKLRYERTTKVVIVIYCAFTCASYYITNNLFNVVLVLLATAFVAIINKDMVLKLSNKVLYR